MEVWAKGDYHTFAKEFVWSVGPELVRACEIGPGDHVLDVAAGTGNVALRAAQAGAAVVACDITPEQLEAGRREAAALGVEVEWVLGDAQALPFGDDRFDVVTSVFGAIFAPDHKRVSDEMLRVCRPGGRVGMANFLPEGTAGAFFELFGRYAPPLPAGAQPPLLWGAEDHVRQLFGDRVASLEMTRRSYVERAATPAAYAALYRRLFGPLITLREALQDDPDAAAAFDADFDAFTRDENVGTSGAEYEYGYLLVVATTRGGAQGGQTVGLGEAGQHADRRPPGGPEHAP